MDPVNTPVKGRKSTKDDPPSIWRKASSQTESTSRTPRFLFAPAASQSSVSQFSATPRFLFGSQANQSGAVQDDIVPSDGELSPTRQVAGSTYISSQLPSKTKDIIEDTDDDVSGEEAGSAFVDKHDNKKIASPPCDTGMQPRDMLSPVSPTYHKPKRRRYFSPSPTKERRKSVMKGPKFDLISSSPEAPSSPLLDDAPVELSPDTRGDYFLTPPRRQPPSTPFQSFGREKLQQTPLTNKRTESILNPLPPDSAHFRHDSENSSSQVLATPGPYSTLRQKPRFIMPSTPDRADVQNTPTQIASPSPFSPLSIRSKRAGGRSRPSATGSDFISGGMASELRSWVFEISTRHQSSTIPSRSSTQLVPPIARPLPPKTAIPPLLHHDGKPSAYYVTAKVAESKYSNPSNQQCRDHGSSAGYPAPFIQVTTPFQQAKSHENCSYNNILLFNPPLHNKLSSNSATIGRNVNRPDISNHELRIGDEIGIRKGIVWEIEIDTCNEGTVVCKQEALEPHEGVKGKTTTHERINPLHKWLVSTEWEMLDQQND